VLQEKTTPGSSPGVVLLIRIGAATFVSLPA